MSCVEQIRQCFVSHLLAPVKAQYKSSICENSCDGIV